ncbi:NAD-dependent protein deacylase [Lachnospiraceae bacterium LCP25S3_G4]
MDIESQIIQLQTIIDSSNHIVFFGGAGVSTESNIPDFRSSDGLYQQQYKYSPEQVVSHSFFVNHTEEFYEFYKKKMMYLDAKPNKAHLKLAELEHAKKLSAIVTQNIDGLHQMAGSKQVLELHGSIHRNYCQTCGAFYDANYIKQTKGIPRCTCCGIIKPDVVLYEEGLDQEVIQQTVHSIANADTLIIGGTSLSVYPAASFIDYFRGKNLVVINREATSRDGEAQLNIQGSIGQIFSKLKV